MSDTNSSTQKPRKAYFLLRAFVVFILCVAALLGVYRLCYHYHANVATWADDTGERQRMIYQDTIYHLAGKVGSKGIGTNAYKTDELLGEVKPQSLFDVTPPLFVWRVENKEGYLILVDEQDDKYLYYAEGEINPAQPKTEANT